MRLILVRHGQTVCNTDNIWHGWDDCRLTEIGAQQAEAVAERLATEPIAAVYSSDSPRALQTASAIARRHGLEPVQDRDLRERNPGDFEGLAVDQIVARNPNIWEERNANLWDWRPPAGETFRDVLARTRGVIERLQGEHAGETVVVVTHMSPVRVLLSDLLDIPIERTYQMEFPSTGVSILSLDGDEPRAEVLNDAAHTA